MLILKRRIGEVIYIGPNIRIVLTDVCSEGQAKIGIEAPDDIQITRDTPPPADFVRVKPDPDPDPDPEGDPSPSV